MGGEVHIVGLGAVSRGAVEQAATRQPSTLFTLFSRNPERHPPFQAANVRISSLGELLNSPASQRSGIPLVICVSVDEARLLATQSSTERTAVAAKNIELVKSVLPSAALRDRLVIVVTNPVEVVGEALRRLSGNPWIFGFGMESDHQRVCEVLRQGFQVDPSSLDVSGLHMFRPIACLDALRPELRAQIAAIPIAAARERLEHYVSPFTVNENRGKPWVRFPSRIESLPLFINEAVAALTQSEFNGSQPPRHRGRAALAQLLSVLGQGERARLSGLIDARRGAWAGGWLDLRTRSFQMPGLSIDEALMLDRDLEQFTSLTRSLLP